ncbi:MAG: PAN domain-containing protein [Pseudomonadota bacterium]
MPVFTRARLRSAGMPFRLPAIAFLLTVSAILVGQPGGSVLAQNTVAPTCPDGYQFSDGKCVEGAPRPSCPDGYEFRDGQCVAAAPRPNCPDGFVFSGGSCVAGTTPTTPAPAQAAQTGPWLIVTLVDLGVKSATDMDGATICTLDGTPQKALSDYAKSQSIEIAAIVGKNQEELIKAYDRQACDGVLLPHDVAGSQARAMPGGATAHIILPQQIGATAANALPVTRPAPQPTEPVRRAAPAPQPAPVRRAAPSRPSEPIETALQRELKRLGCLTGKVDGIWGRGSRAALRKFTQQAGLSLGSEPTQRALEEARRTEQGFCRPVRTASRPANTNRSRRGSPDFDIQEGYDLPGNDYRQVRGKVSFNTCLSTCENDSECFAFTYNTSAQACFLKWEGSNWKRYANAISGMRYGSRTQSEIDRDDEIARAREEALTREIEEREQREWEEEQRRIRELEEQEDEANEWDNSQFADDENDVCIRSCEEDDAVCGGDDACLDEFDGCLAQCAFEIGQCHTFSDGETVCP